MKLRAYRTGIKLRHARAIGCSLTFGFFDMEDEDTTSKQLNLSFGFWWFIVRLEIWSASVPSVALEVSP